MNKSLVKEVGKLLVIGFPGKEVPDYIRRMMHQYHIGGMILFSRNIGTPEEVLRLTTDLQKEAKKAGYTHPLLICVDQENGVVRRLGEGTTIFPGAMALGATNNPKNAYHIGLATAKELKALGINWNLAPVLDVNNNPDNPVIGVRSFGESAEMVADFGRQMMQGMQDGGVITTLKHFPGHGDTNVDSHLDLPVISHHKERLKKVELLPFQTSIDAGADTVMSAHVYFPAIESKQGVPATLSKKVITELLRTELAFDGVVTTDCLEMRAIANGVGTEQSAVEAIKAGVDLLIISHTANKQQDTIQKIIQLIEANELDRSFITQSIRRIDSLKEKYLHWDDIQLVGEEAVPKVINCKQHEEIAYQMYKESITVVKNENVIPVSLKEKDRVLVLWPNDGGTMGVEDKRHTTHALDEAVKSYHKEVDKIDVTDDMTALDIEEIVAKAHHYDFIFVGTLTITIGSKQVTLVEKLAQAQLSFVVIAMRSPYDLRYIPQVKAYINTYEFTYPALQVAAGAVFGKEKVSGTSPVTIFP
ncbi:beta-N-acetylhexosaminidase [Virgibacillus dokdonensis]|uniref:beta-N-acetylhexosaminidase n=1 Tax=Virgibacillus dokdonensis TaxID=302167 RepID=A0A2K9IUY6_9BACI|nr:beta-N-acetylhexosaminidase [Virgibacillus dokdonensis]AUJ23582.1 putative lipoprotein YbbD precursor [Virgibacillus dokdonensis]